MKNSALDALRTIAGFPITDPKNQDAVNIRAIAVSALAGLKDEIKQVEVEARTRLEEKVISIIEDVTGIDPKKIKLSSYFNKNLRLDNLDMIEIIMNVEETFNVEITDDITFKKVSDIVDFLNNQVLSETS